MKKTKAMNAMKIFTYKIFLTHHSKVHFENWMVVVCCRKVVILEVVKALFSYRVRDEFM